MAARILDGKAVAQAIRDELRGEVEAFTAFTGVTPHLAAVLTGDDPASNVYVRTKRRACEAVGMGSSLVRLPADVSQAELEATVDRLNEDASVHGILVQLPLPAGLGPAPIIRRIDPAKDVDGFHPWNVGMLAQGLEGFRPCTPAGVLELLRRSGIPVAGRDVVVVGRSQLVGQPVSVMLGAKGVDATVTLCHSRTADLAAHTRRAEILIVAIGRAGAITGDMVRPGAVVIDVGTNRAADGRLVGDVEFDAAKEVASAITPVPGGVGPMTVAMLLVNTLRAARGLASASS